MHVCDKKYLICTKGLQWQVTLPYKPLLLILLPRSHTVNSFLCIFIKIILDIYKHR